MTLEEERERTAESKERLLGVLRELPIITAACKRAIVSKATYYRWRKEDPAFLRDSDQAYRDGIEFISDMSEVQLIALIKDGAMPAIAMWLKNHSPAYGGKVEPERQSSETPLTDEQKRLIRKALRAYTPAPAQRMP